MAGTFYVVPNFTPTTRIGFTVSGNGWLLAPSVSGSLRLSFIPPDSGGISNSFWVLDGATLLTYATLPLGFKVLSAKCHFGVFNPQVAGTHTYAAQFDVATQGPFQSIGNLDFVHAAPIPTALQIYTNGMGIVADNGLQTLEVGYNNPLPYVAIIGTYELQPTITSITPLKGTKFGAKSVLIIGTGFNDPLNPVINVFFGSTPATSIVVVDDSHLTCVTPAHAPGIVNVTVQLNDLANAILVNGYTYKDTKVTSVFPPQQGIFGGDPVAVEGIGFIDGGTVTGIIFDTSYATNVSDLNDEVIDCKTPAHPKGAVYVTVIMDGVNFVVSDTPIFEYIQYSWTLQNPDIPVSVGDPVTITSHDGSGGLDETETIEITYTEDGIHKVIDIPIDSYYVIWWEFDILEFYLPLELQGFQGTITITLISYNNTNSSRRRNSSGAGDPGTQFYGSIVVGTLDVLFENASGIYKLVKNQAKDILYFRDGFTTNTKLLMLPDVLEPEIYEDDFFYLLNYPYKILARDDTDEDIMAKDFLRSSTLQPVIITRDVEIPSPFVKTAFLP